MSPVFRHARWVGTLAAILAMTPVCFAADSVIGEAISSLAVDCGASVDTHPTDYAQGPAGLSLGCDRKFSNLGATGTGVAHGQTALSKRPWAEATSFASSTGAVNPDYGLFGFSAGASATSRVEYQVKLVPLMAPPRPLDPAIGVPALVTARGEVHSEPPAEITGGNHVLAGAGSFGEVAVAVIDGLYNRIGWRATHTNVGPPDARFEGTAPMALFTDWPARVTISAACNSGAQVFDAPVMYSVSIAAECQAAVDPIFTLDQAAFDQAMGADSYRLVDYYAIEYSPNMVPEPSRLAMSVMGLMLLGVFSARIRRSI